ncbi:MAG: NADH-quinone oxidoreductase subunit NuoE [Pseudomonadota bacterium]
MAVRRLAEEQPDSFALTSDNEAWAAALIAKYPEGRQASAVIPLLWRAQKQNGGWLSEPALRCVADRLGMAYIRVLEVATFYTMFNLKPVGEFFVQVCTTTPCMLRGSDEVVSICRRQIHENPETVTADGKFSWMEVECLGACANAPMVQINDDYFEDLDASRMEVILAKLRRGDAVKPGPQSDRHGSEPSGGLTSLTDPDLYAYEKAR